MPRRKTGLPHSKPPELLRKRALWLGLDLTAMSRAGGLSAAHVRAMLNGYSRVTEEFANLLLGMTLQAAADLRVECAGKTRPQARKFRPPRTPASAPARVGS